jgi:HSP20 family protein
MDDLFDRFFDREDWLPSRMSRSLRSFQRDLDDLFADFFGPNWPALPAPEQTGTFWPRVETSVGDGEYIVRAELPGFGPDNIEVNQAGDTLTIRGELKTEGEGEASHRRFSRSFTLPEGVEPDKVKATLAHGVLELRMPASPKLVGKRVPIEVGPGEPRKELRAA